ncbi:MAG: YciI family protein [Pyrinomonadaceae bacterium]
MKIRILLAILSLPLLVSFSFAQPKEENKLVQFHMAVLKKGPKWDGVVEPAKNPTLKQHLAYFVSLLDSGKAIIGGPMPDSKDFAGIYILRANSAEEARTWTDADPAVRAGLFTAEMHPWWSEDIFKKATTTPLKMETVYLGFLKRGPNRKEGDGNTSEVQELQKAHIANINRLAATKKLVMAGPFGGNGDLRGIFVFRVGSLKEAQDLAATDPMIKIDRLRLELHPWRVPAGVIP